MTDDSEDRGRLARCAMCADMCKYSCPTYLASGRETLSPQKMARLILYDEKDFLEDEEGFLDLMFQSAMCGACHRHCIYDDHDLRDFMHEARVKAFARGALPADVRQRLETFGRFGNPHGEREVRDHGAGELGYFIACSSYKDEVLLGATEQVISQSGLEIRHFGGGEICCGAPLYYAGDMEGFRRVAAKMKGEIETRGLRRVVIDCPTCVKLMTDAYPQAGQRLDVEILHTTQFMHDLLNRGMLRFAPGKGTVTFHDPCILSFDLGLTAPPREIIAALGFDLKEPVYSGEHTHCCGAAYGAKIGDRLLKDAVTAMRTKELLETGAGSFVTACPTCKSVLTGIVMKYITELVAERTVATR